MFFVCVENTSVQFLCYELVSIRKGTSERAQGTGELCSIIIISSRPMNVFIVSACACRNTTS